MSPFYPREASCALEGTRAVCLLGLWDRLSSHFTIREKQNPLVGATAINLVEYPGFENLSSDIVRMISPVREKRTLDPERERARRPLDDKQKPARIGTPIYGVGIRISFLNYVFGRFYEAMDFGFFLHALFLPHLRTT